MVVGMSRLKPDPGGTVREERQPFIGSTYHPTTQRQSWGGRRCRAHAPINHSLKEIQGFYGKSRVFFFLEGSGFFANGPGGAQIPSEATPKVPSQRC